MNEIGWFLDESISGMLDLVASGEYATNRQIQLFACSLIRSMDSVLSTCLSDVVAAAEFDADACQPVKSVYRPALAGGDDWHELYHSLVNVMWAKTLPSACFHAKTLAEAVAREAMEKPVDLCGILQDIVGNPFHPVAGLCAPCATGDRRNIDPACAACLTVLTQPVVAFAKRIYDSPYGSGGIDSDTLRVFSDALEEAGCCNEKILKNLRGFAWRIPPWLASQARMRFRRNQRNRVVTQVPQFEWLKVTVPRYRGMWSLDCALKNHRKNQNPI